MATDSPKAVTLYYSYAHADEALRNNLEKHLSALKRQKYIHTWCDREISPGTDWEVDVDKHLETADIILLLISSDFIASDYCYSKEIGLALERHRLGTARVIPILLRPVDWHGTGFEKLQALPKDGKPVVSWNSLDDGFVDIVSGIRLVIDTIRAASSSSITVQPISTVSKNDKLPQPSGLDPSGHTGVSDSTITGDSKNRKNRKHILKFLTLTPEELIKRYADESLLTLDIGLLPGLSLPHAVISSEGKLVLPQAVVYENTAHLPLESFHFQVDSQYPDYTLPQKIKSKAEHLLSLQRQNSNMFDSATIRLNRVEPHTDGATFVVSKAHYFDYVGTNYSMDAHLDDWRSSLRDTVHPDKHLEPLDTSLLANHIGLGAILFTADNFIILPVRSKKGVNIWQGEISPSVSGATNYTRDINRFKDGDIIGWIAGEAAEELNLEWDHIDSNSFNLLGVTRELLRGGKPEMFFFAQLTITRSEVEKRFATAQDRAENSELLWMDMPHPGESVTEKDLIELREDIQRLLIKYGERLSHPALANLTLYYRWYSQQVVPQK